MEAGTCINLAVSQRQQEKNWRKLLMADEGSNGETGCVSILGLSVLSCLCVGFIEIVLAE